MGVRVRVRVRIGVRVRGSMRLECSERRRATSCIMRRTSASLLTPSART